MSYLLLIENSLGNLFSDSSHNPSARVRTSPTDPNSSNFATHPVCEQILNANAAMKNIAFC